MPRKQTATPPPRKGAMVKVLDQAMQAQEIKKLSLAARQARLLEVLGRKK